MPPPKSQRLLREEDQQSGRQTILPPEPDAVPVYAPGTVIKIKEVRCFNDFVAILQFRINTGKVLVAENSAYKNEGIVIGHGPGLPNGAGGRCPSQLKLGLVVSFYGNPTLILTPKQGLFAGQKVVIVPERAIICELPPVPFEIVEDRKADEEPRTHV